MVGLHSWKWKLSPDITGPRAHCVTQIILSPRLLAVFASVTSLADTLCLGGLKTLAGTCKIKSHSLLLIPEESMAAFSTPASDPSVTQALPGLCVCPLTNHGFQKDRVSDWTACHVASPVTGGRWLHLRAPPNQLEWGRGSFQIGNGRQIKIKCNTCPLQRNNLGK